MKRIMFKIGALLFVVAAVLPTGSASALASVESAPQPSASSLERLPVVRDIPAWDKAPFPNTVTVKNGKASYTCTVFASDVYWSQQGVELYGDGDQICSGTGFNQSALRVTIQRYAGLGVWNNKARVDIPLGNWSNSLSHRAYYNCNGTGTETYRVVVDGYAAYGNSHLSDVSNTYKQVTC
jgi:hypothetical protein